MVWYSDNDPRCAAWLRELIRTRALPPGEVDERDIRDLGPDDCPDSAHFFAGIGGWALALRLAGWSDAAPVWTGSCPCQPFSVAGRRGGTADARHLWPVWRNLIAERLPPTIFGEQVASPLGREWLAGVRADLEALGYVVGAADLCAAGAGAPHIRQRLFFGAARVANGASTRWRRAGRSGKTSTESETVERPARLREASGLAVSEHAERWALCEPLEDERDWSHGQREETHCELGARCEVRRVGDDERKRREISSERDSATERRIEARSLGTDASRSGFWSDFNLVWCRDGVFRRIEPGAFPLAHGLPARVGRLRGYGNAIVPQLAAEFVRCFVMSVEEVLK